jgi:hypothetical protein
MAVLGLTMASLLRAQRDLEAISLQFRPQADKAPEMLKGEMKLLLCAA